MFFVSNIDTTAPDKFDTPLQKEPFKSKDFSNSLGVARFSFTPADLMEKILGTKIGAAAVFGAILDNDNAVQIVFDKDVLAEEWYGCSDGTTTGYMKEPAKLAQWCSFLDSSGFCAASKMQH